MKKILIILRREYLSRVQKKSFIVMTILGPILMAALFVVPVYLANVSDQHKKIAVLDETGLFHDKFPNSNKVIFENVYMSYQAASENLEALGYDAVLYIPESVINNPNAVKMSSEKDMGFGIVDLIEGVIKKELEAHRLSLSGIDKKILDNVNVNVKISTYILREGEEEQSFSEISYILGMLGGILIYTFIFLYGSQVMRGVIEEKTNRIVEVIVSSIKPFQLMLGKIVGVALVGLTQFVLWIGLTAVIVFSLQQLNPDMFKYKEPPKVMVQDKGLSQSDMAQQQEALQLSESRSNQILEGISHIQFGNILIVFVFYFLFGYLLYASMFAAIGSAVDNDADTQQFMLPVTVPLILALVSLNFVLNNPDGPVSFWLSMIPFTSPIVMMARIPFNPPVPLWEIGLSMAFLIAGFILTTWIAGRIYRTGILMYGKKPTVRELFKWMKY
ncbi:MAG TPA: ABC transporter permease [Bacteroidales bacterium]|nr:ABC transporter permease [Bacteroidales bacterium]